MGVHYLRHHLFRIGHHTPTDPHADRVGPFRQSAPIYGRNDKGTITCECYDHLQSCVNDNLVCFVCSWQESSELTEYQACRRKLIRTSIFFALLFLILKSPANFIFLSPACRPMYFPKSSQTGLQIGRFLPTVWACWIRPFTLLLSSLWVMKWNFIAVANLDVVWDLQMLHNQS